jgi:hypothetical protein
VEKKFSASVLSLQQKRPTAYGAEMMRVSVEIKTMQAKHRFMNVFVPFVGWPAMPNTNKSCLLDPRRFAKHQ